MAGLPVVFFSDAHLGAESKAREAGREARLHSFLKSLGGRISRLIIVGDLFDFWFEYRSAIPRRYFATLELLGRLRSAGIEMDYLNGNHDFWLGPFLSDDLGIRTHHGAMTLEHDGRRIWIHHGDALVGGDHGYRLLKRVLRHPASIALYRLIHPDFGIPLARWVSSGRSRPSGCGARSRSHALPRGSMRSCSGTSIMPTSAGKAGASCSCSATGSSTSRT